MAGAPRKRLSRRLQGKGKNGFGLARGGPAAGPDREAIFLTTPRHSDNRKLPPPLSLALGALTSFLAILTPSITETAVANGDTRTIYLHHAHTGEDIAATYLVNGQYDNRVLEQLNWFLRDWRRDEPTNMDPRLFDVVWEAYRTAGAGNQVINVVSAYRSPETNAMLRARSRAVAKYSQHMLGKAMDTTLPGMPMSQVREIGMRMQRGGVGYYPNANTPFVHLDVGNVRSWPRMSYEQLVRLFPDGKTVHLPANGQPLPGYEEAKAEIEARGNGAYVVAAPRRTFGGFFAALFGMNGGEDEDAEIAAPPPNARKQWAALAPRNARNAAADYEGGGEEGGEAEAPTSRRGRSQIARAETDLPRGETAMTASGAIALAPQTGRAALTAAPPEGETAQEPAQEEPKKPKCASVPLPPPGRPASLDKPSPLDQKAAAVAAVEPSSALEPESRSDEPAALRHFVNAPAPPRRPAGLLAFAAAKPEALPPERSQKQERRSGASHAIAKMVEEQDEGVNKDDPALAYAPQGKTSAPKQEESVAKAGKNTVAEKADFVPARLDRSNFNTLTTATSAVRVSGRSVLGAPITAVRSAARATAPSVLLPPARPANIVGFAPPQLQPPANKFTSGETRARGSGPTIESRPKN